MVGILLDVASLEVVLDFEFELRLEEGVVPTRDVLDPPPASELGDHPVLHQSHHQDNSDDREDGEHDSFE